MWPCQRLRTLDEPTRRRLLGRYGAQAPRLVAAAQPGELEPIPGTHTLWAELRWAARSEQVCHLDDLLLRRTRLGLLLPQGGAAIFPALQRICQQELGWTAERWQSEQTRYQELWRRCYSLPPAEPDPRLAGAGQAGAGRPRRPALPAPPRPAPDRPGGAAGWAGLVRLLALPPEQVEMNNDENRFTQRTQRYTKDTKIF